MLALQHASRVLHSVMHHITPAASVLSSCTAGYYLLLQVLSYHVIPSAAIPSSKLADGEKLTTALAGAVPVVVKVRQLDKSFEIL